MRKRERKRGSKQEEIKKLISNGHKGKEQETGDGEGKREEIN